MARTLSHLAFVALLWLGLDRATPAHAQPAQALPTWTVTMRDGAFTPARLDVPAGQRIKLILRNEGTRPLEFENIDLRIEKVRAPKAESFVVFKLPPGEHVFIDEFNPTAGKLLVVAK